MAEKTCRACGVTKPTEDFYLRASNKDGFEKECKQCKSSARKSRYSENKEATLARNKLWREANKKRVSEQARIKTLRKYNLSPELYDQLLTEQGGACKGCSVVPPAGINLQVDHDHGCCPGNNSCGKCIRGLLCMKCNTILGKAGDNPAVLRALASYLEGGEF